MATAQYKAGGYEKDDLSVWLQRAGYHTMLVGKYLHDGYDFVVPPGWDDFYCSLGNKYFGTSRFTTKLRATGSHSRLPDDEYRTTVEANDAQWLIEQHVLSPTESSQPFFLYLAPLAPHDPAPNAPAIAPQNLDDWTDLHVPREANFNEPDISDKPSAIASLPSLTTEQETAPR